MIFNYTGRMHIFFNVLIFVTVPFQMKQIPETSYFICEVEQYNF